MTLDEHIRNDLQMSMLAKQTKVLNNLEKMQQILKVTEIYSQTVALFGD